MNYMSQWVKNLGERLKALELGERYIRRSWLYYPEAVRTFFRLQEASLDERKAFAERRLETVLRAASKTAYGREFRGKPLHEWPLMPLVRYQMADLITLPKDVNPELVCWGVQPFKGVQGRQSDYLISPEGARLIAINHIPRDVDHVVRMQIIQEQSDYVRILVIPDEGFTESNRQQILANARLKIPESMEISVELVESLERTPSGKTPYVIRKFES